MQLIYGPVSPTSRIVTFFLPDNNIDFDCKLVNILKGEQLQPDVAAANPNCGTAGATA
jgi:glutathione S-transferase